MLRGRQTVHLYKSPYKQNWDFLIEAIRLKIENYLLKRVNIPEPKNWDDLSPKQIINIMKVLHSGADIETIPVTLLWILIEPKTMIQKWFFRYKFTDKDLILLLPMTEFLFKDKNLSVNKWPVIRIKGSDYIGPKDNLTDLTFDQFGS